MITPFELDKMRSLRFNFKAINLIEKKLNKSFFGINFNDLKVDEIATIIWAGLYHEDSLLTPDLVLELLDQYSSIAKATKAMNDALQECFDLTEGK